MKGNGHLTEAEILTRAVIRRLRRIGETMTATDVEEFLTKDVDSPVLETIVRGYLLEGRPASALPLMLSSEQVEAAALSILHDWLCRLDKRWP